jgi:hypothetical protein
LTARLAENRNRAEKLLMSKHQQRNSQLGKLKKEIFEKFSNQFPKELMLDQKVKEEIQKLEAKIKKLQF